MAQAVSRRPVNLVAGDWVHSRVGSCGYFDAPNDAGTGFRIE